MRAWKHSNAFQCLLSGRCIQTPLKCFSVALACGVRWFLAYWMPFYSKTCYSSSVNRLIEIVSWHIFDLCKLCQVSLTLSDPMGVCRNRWYWIPIGSRRTSELQGSDRTRDHSDTFRRPTTSYRNPIPTILTGSNCRIVRCGLLHLLLNNGHIMTNKQNV